MFTLAKEYISSSYLQNHFLFTNNVKPSPFFLSRFAYLNWGEEAVKHASLPYLKSITSLSDNLVYAYIYCRVNSILNQKNGYSFKNPVRFHAWSGINEKRR